jgi:hypothetical protein
MRPVLGTEVLEPNMKLKRLAVSSIADDDMAVIDAASASTRRSKSECVILNKDPSAINSTHTNELVCSRFSSSEHDSDDNSPHDSAAESDDDFEDDFVDNFDDDFDDCYPQGPKDNRWGRTVTIHVGRDEVPFKLHTMSLIEKSPYFRKRFRRCVKRSVGVATISVQYFEMYTHWVYTSQLDFSALGYLEDGKDFVTWLAVGANGDDIGRDSNVNRHLEKTSDWAHRLIVLWVHAGSLGDVQLQNTISEQLERWWFERHLVVSIPRRSFVFVGKHTSSGSPLRKLCIDWADLSSVFRSRVGSQVEVKNFPRWLTNELLRMKTSRERGTLEDDPRKMDLSTRGRYYVRCNGCCDGC